MKDKELWINKTINSKEYKDYKIKGINKETKLEYLFVDGVMSYRTFCSLNDAFKFSRPTVGTLIDRVLYYPDWVDDIYLFGLKGAKECIDILIKYNLVSPDFPNCIEINKKYYKKYPRKYNDIICRKDVIDRLIVIIRNIDYDDDYYLKFNEEFILISTVNKEKEMSQFYILECSEIRFIFYVNNMTNPELENHLINTFQDIWIHYESTEDNSNITKLITKTKKKER